MWPKLEYRGRMKKEEVSQDIVFDKFADGYNISLTNTVRASGFPASYFHEYKTIELFEYLKKQGKEYQNLTLLDFGCGVGSSEKYLKKYMPNLEISACDLSPLSINEAVKENKKLVDVEYKVFDGVNVPFNKKFDIIYIANVFHHIPRRLRLVVMKNLFTKLNDDGFVIMFELNPINPMTLWVAIQNDYKFDKEAKLLNPFYCRKLLKNSGFKKLKIRFTVFFPKYFIFLKKIEKYICKLPLGAHYYYVAQKE